MEAPKPAHRAPLSAAIIGFLAGCAVMYFLASRETPPANTPAPAPSTAPQTQHPNTATSPNPPAQPAPKPTPMRGAAARHALNEIKRANIASVNIRFFATNDGKLSRQFTDFFELTPDESSELSGLLQTTKAEMWNAAKAHAQTSQTETGGIVIKIPPVSAGPDIYDKVMNGFRALLGDDRYNDMMLYNGGQLENLFNQFGGEKRTITIEKRADDRYDINIETETRPGWKSSQTATLRRDEIGQWKPGLEDFLPPPPPPPAE